MFRFTQYIIKLTYNNKIISTCYYTVDKGHDINYKTVTWFMIYTNRLIIII